MSEKGAIQVVLVWPMNERVETWLKSQGLYLFKMPIQEEDDLPTYGVGIGEVPGRMHKVYPGITEACGGGAIDRWHIGTHGLCAGCQCECHSQMPWREPVDDRRPGCDCPSGSVCRDCGSEH